jgi:hypothetical protein
VRCAQRVLEERFGIPWSATMQVGSGFQVHVRLDELPDGRLFLRVSGHYTTMIHGIVRDNHNPSRGGA